MPETTHPGSEAGSNESDWEYVISSDAGDPIPITIANPSSRNVHTNRSQRPSFETGTAYSHGFRTKGRRYRGDPAQGTHTLAGKLSQEMSKLDRTISTLRKREGLWTRIRQPTIDRRLVECEKMRAYGAALQTAVSGTIKDDYRLGPAEDDELVRLSMVAANNMQKSVPSRLVRSTFGRSNHETMNRLESLHDQANTVAMSYIVGPEYGQICQKKADTFFRIGATKTNPSEMTERERKIRAAIMADPTRGSRPCGTITLRNGGRRRTTRLSLFSRKKPTYSQWGPTACACTIRSTRPSVQHRYSRRWDHSTTNMTDVPRRTSVTPRRRRGSEGTGYRGHEHKAAGYEGVAVESQNPAGAPQPGGYRRTQSRDNGFDVVNESLFAMMGHGLQSPADESLPGAYMNGAQSSATGWGGASYGGGDTNGNRADAGPVLGFANTLTPAPSQTPSASGYRRRGRPTGNRRAKWGKRGYEGQG